MKEDLFQIRIANTSDAEALLEIYRPYVEKTAITFEYEVPSLTEFKGRIDKTLDKYPYLVAEQNGHILGYAYASSFIPRAACDWAVETSIYVENTKKKMGVGKTLYFELERLLKRQGILNLNACIAYPEVEDEYLTKNSVEFHKHLGYQWVGQFHNCGYKFGRWYHLVWMEKHLGSHVEAPAPPKNFQNVELGT